MVSDKSLYALSDRWRDYESPDFRLTKKPMKKDTRDGGMGRGLSPLHRRILDFANQDDRGVVYSFQVLARVYQFPMTKAGRVGGIHFDRRQIGRRHFSGTVAVSRAFNRIACREAAERIIGGQGSSGSQNS